MTVSRGYALAERELQSFDRSVVARCHVQRPDRYRLLESLPVDVVGLNDHRAARLHHDRRAKLCHLASRHPTHLLVPRAWVPLFSPPFSLAPVAAFDDPVYTQVEPPHPHGVLLLAVVGVDPAFAAGCPDNLVPSAP